MQFKVSKRIKNTPKSFIREILKLTQSPEIISFAGGLPNRDLFPVEEIKISADKVLTQHGKDILQYTVTEGYLPLREYIANRYKSKADIDVSVDEILVVSGSQQGLDLIGKCLIDENDSVIMENPSYLGAIQAMSVYMPNFCPITLESDGVNPKELDEMARKHESKLFYAIPNFQNPTGLTYSNSKRVSIGEKILANNMILIEDDPYGEIRFLGEDLPPIKKYIGKNGILMGSFSKIAAPGFRIGWVCADKEIMKYLVVAKQGTDLHTSNFAQRVLCQYLEDYDLDMHIDKIKQAYLKQRNAMVDSIDELFPKEVTVTKAEGGMFLWGTLPEGKSAIELFNRSTKAGVAFVPGEPFYMDNKPSRSFRLNYTSVEPEIIKKGIKILANTIKEYINN